MTRLPAEPEIQGVAVVLVGSFNPAIFRTDWLVRYKLVSEDAAVKAEQVIISPQLAILNLPWAALQVQPQRFEASASSREHFEALRDLVVGALTVLEHTPFNQLGVNHMAHYRAPSVDFWHTVGHVLAPKAMWHKYLEHPGMLSLTIRGRRPGATDSRLDVTVQPSIKVQPGVYVQTTEHYERSPDDVNAASELLDLLQSRWDTMLQHARETGQGVMDAGLDAEE